MVVKRTVGEGFQLAEYNTQSVSAVMTVGSELTNRPFTTGA